MCGMNYLSIPKLQRLHRWSLGMDKTFHPTFYNGCNYLSMLGLKLNRVSKRGPGVLRTNSGFIELFSVYTEFQGLVQIIWSAIVLKRHGFFCGDGLLRKILHSLILYCLEVKTQNVAVLMDLRLQDLGSKQTLCLPQTQKRAASHLFWQYCKLKTRQGFGFLNAAHRQLTCHKI